MNQYKFDSYINSIATVTNENTTQSKLKHNSINDADWNKNILNNSPSPYLSKVEYRFQSFDAS